MTTLTIETEPLPKDSLYIQEHWMQNDPEENSGIDLTITRSGGNVFFYLTLPDGRTVRESIDIAFLANKWVRQVYDELTGWDEEDV